MTIRTRNDLKWLTRDIAYEGSNTELIKDYEEELENEVVWTELHKDPGTVVSSDELMNHYSSTGWSNENVWCTGCGSEPCLEYHNHITQEDYKKMDIIAFCPHCDLWKEFVPELIEMEEE